MLRTLSGKPYIPIAVSRLLGPSSFQRGTSSAVVNYETEKKEIEQKLKEELPGPYEGPERDLVNFPRRKRALESGKVRMGFIPEEWFEFFYKKTGVTGPYVFGTGLVTYLLSKEWYVIEEEFSTGLAILLLTYISVKKFGPAVTAFRDKSQQEEYDFAAKEREQFIGELQEGISEIKKCQWQTEGRKILMDAKRENVMMQLETEYRRRLMNVYDKTKRRLDYHLDLYNTKRKLEQTHMVDWIVNSVVKSITPEQEKEALKKCVEDLNALAVKMP